MIAELSDCRVCMKVQVVFLLNSKGLDVIASTALWHSNHVATAVAGFATAAALNLSEVLVRLLENSI